MKYQFSIGEQVRIKSGPFQNFTAEITEINEKEGSHKVKLKVTVNIFGRIQPIELTPLDVEKIN